MPIKSHHARRLAPRRRKGTPYQKSHQSLNATENTAATAQSGPSAQPTATATEITLRELDLRERELSLRERESETKLKIERKGLMYSSPILIALISTVLGTAIGAGLQGYSDGRLERLKFEFSLVEGAFENTERDEAAKQLRFIANSGVIVNLDVDKLRTLAETPDEIPKASFSDTLNSFYLYRLSEEARELHKAKQATFLVQGEITENTKVRESPSSSSSVLFELAKGEQVLLGRSGIDLTSDSSNNLWINIKSESTGKTGWVRIETIRSAGTVSSTLRDEDKTELYDLDFGE